MIGKTINPQTHFTRINPLEPRATNNNTFRPTSSRLFLGLITLTGVLQNTYAARGQLQTTPFAPPTTYFPTSNNQCLNWPEQGEPPAFSAAQLKPFTHPNGVTVQSFMPNGELHGDAIKTYPDGGTDMGYFDASAFVYGTRTYPSQKGGQTQRGQFFADVLEGTCSTEFLNGDTKVGTCHEGRLIRGTETYTDGLKITGEFDSKENLTEGTVVTQDGRTLQGTFSNKRLHGENCTIKYPNGAIATGKYINGEMAYGIITLTNGVVLEGSFNKNGKLHGENCTTKYADGGVATGKYINGEMVYGTATAKSGGVHQGTFKGVHLHGDNCFRKYFNGATEEGTFHQGKLVQGNRTDVCGTQQFGRFNPETDDLEEGKILFKGGLTRTVPFDWTFGLAKILFG